jgi:hypothetical protein
MSQEIVGRNEPCPCGSKKKYKRCCGMDAAPKLTTPAAGANPMAGAGAGGAPAGFDPSQFDPQMMLQFSQMLGRLPKGQLQKLQNLMQRAMSGKDVTREAKEFESSLPVEFQSMLAGFQMPGMPGMGSTGSNDALPGSGAMPEVLPALTGNSGPGGMSEEEARAIVEAAAKDGKISSDQAQDLLAVDPTKEAKGVSKLWKKFSGK